jgi:predicted RNA binding protein YcfA (HicA-like mRNA interferase family)
MILCDPQGRRVTLPYHAGKIIHPKVLAMIMDDAGLAEADFEE